MAAFDMNWIMVFNAIFEEKTLTRAAEKLGMSEKTLGLILKKLRDYFADPLFIRSNTGFTATPVATELYLKFYKTQMYLQQALMPRAINAEKEADQKIILSIAAHAEFAFNQVYSNTADLFARYSLRMHAAESPEKEINNLRLSFTDIYISLSPLEDSFIVNDMITTISMNLCLIVRRNHANVVKILQHDLSEEKFASCTKYPILEEYLADEMTFPPNIVYRGQSLLNLLSITEQRDLVLIAPLYLSTLLKLDERFHVIHLVSDNSITKTAYCSYLKNSKKKDSIKEINKLIKNEAQALQLRVAL